MNLVSRNCSTITDFVSLCRFLTSLRERELSCHLSMGLKSPSIHVQTIITHHAGVCVLCVVSFLFPCTSLQFPFLEDIISVRLCFQIPTRHATLSERILLRMNETPRSTSIPRPRSSLSINVNRKQHIQPFKNPPTAQPPQQASPTKHDGSHTAPPPAYTSPARQDHPTSPLK